MDSKKLPLWCVFENEDHGGPPAHIIFKSGDDLRQGKRLLDWIRLDWVGLDREIKKEDF